MPTIDVDDAAGVVRVRWDDTARVRTEWDKDGTQTDQQPYTTEENAAADQRAIEEQARLAYEQTRQAIKAIVTDLKAEKDRAQAVIDNANATSREKDLGRACKRIADAAIDLARFVKDM